MEKNKTQRLFGTSYGKNNLEDSDVDGKVVLKKQNEMCELYNHVS